jgi:hypothetical protein
MIATEYWGKQHEDNQRKEQMRSFKPMGDYGFR